MNRHAHIIGTTALLMVCLLVFEFTPLDLIVQEWFYLPGQEHWVLAKDGPILRFFLYDGIKVVLFLFTFSLLGLLIASNKYPWIKPYNAGLRVVVLSMIAVPLTISILKATTNMACPVKLQPFGGSLPYVGLFSNAPYVGQRCFPAGHASGGFALLSMVFLFQSQINKLRSLLLALVVAWMMGIYKMAIGDHFLSHTIVSMLCAWLIINVIVIIDEGAFGKASLSTSN